MQLGTPERRFGSRQGRARAAGRGRSSPRTSAAIRGPELVALLAEYDRTGGTGIGSGAEDWAKLPQRMNYILNLFRSRQQDAALLRPPFTAPSGPRCRKDGSRRGDL